jgi:hypothetical protein
MFVIMIAIQGRLIARRPRMSNASSRALAPACFQGSSAVSVFAYAIAMARSWERLGGVLFSQLLIAGSAVSSS